MVFFSEGEKANQRAKSQKGKGLDQVESYTGVSHKKERNVNR